MSLSEFLHMGGYALYVWSSYTVALIVLLANVLNPYFRKKRLIRELARKARLRSRIR
jgi:heme exporter protein D